MTGKTLDVSVVERNRFGYNLNDKDWPSSYPDSDTASVSSSLVVERDSGSILGAEDGSNDSEFPSAQFSDKTHSAPAVVTVLPGFPEFISTSTERKEATIALDFSEGHEEVPAPGYLDILNGSQFSPAKLILDRAGKSQPASCPSLWTGSTQGIESIAGDDAGCRSLSRDFSLKGPLAGIKQPEAGVFLLSEFGTDHDFTSVEKTRASELSNEAMVDCLWASPEPHAALVPPRWDSLQVALQAPAMLAKPRPCVCDICQKSFNRQEDIRRHKRSHTEVYNFFCGDFDQRYPTKGLLRLYQTLQHSATSAFPGPGAYRLQDEAEASHPDDGIWEVNSIIEEMKIRRLNRLTTAPPRLRVPVTMRRAAELEAVEQGSNSAKPPQSRMISDDESYITADDSSELGSFEGDYCSDYTPDFPYMDDDHPFMKQKGRVLGALLQRFWRGPQLKACVGGQDTSRGDESRLSPKGKLPEGRSKRPREREGNGEARDASSDQDPRTAKQRKRRLDKSRRPCLACPFYKKAPARYCSCHSKIISTISHLKQHLSRNHQLPVYCAICKAVFPEEADRDAHTVQQTCQLRTDITHDGLTTGQKAKLAIRASPTIPEEQQWFEIFDILFPGYCPRPTSAYIHGELVAETENYQDFERMEGPAIILEVLGRAGVRIENVSNPEHDLSVFRENLLADALTAIARRWLESRDSRQSTEAPVLDGSSSSVVGTTTSTTGGTLVEQQDVLRTEAEESLAEEADDGGGTRSLQLEEPATSPTMLSPNWLESQRLGHENGGFGETVEHQEESLFEFNGNWEDNGSWADAFRNG
ncbi:hypothetical protein B0T14DRAFT_579591 [Immersiella caudata]|uniref:C2H2-type domain-containing protein n=1 Tax=Immersiella caudata TaxID=314043 RepID=A0AA39X543_9PEZI|nr:hypothetical protein B0T14DRAFT_579591 [Immersiella caudata]